MSSTRAPLLAGLDPVLAAHVAAALARYRRWLDDVDRPAPDGFDELAAATVRVARSGQLRRAPHLAGDAVRMGDLLPLGDAALVAGVSVRTLRRRVAEGRLPVRRIGRRVLVDQHDLLDWLESCAA